MNDTVNRQILLVEKPTGKLGPEHFKMVNGSGARAEGRRGAGAGALHLARCRQPRLDARRHLSRRRRGQHRDGRRQHRRGGVVESARPCRRAISCSATPAGRIMPRVPAKHLTKMPKHGADDASAQRLRHRRPHRLFRPAPCRQAQGGRDRRGVGRRRLGRLDRRPDRQDQGLPRRRHRRRQGQVPLADAANSASTPRSITRTARPTRRCARPRQRASTSISTMSAATFSKPVSR